MPITGTSPAIHVPAAGGGGYGPGARVSVLSALNQLSTAGYQWAYTDWDDAHFVTTYGAATGHGSNLNTNAVVFVVPKTARYRIVWSVLTSTQTFQDVSHASSGIYWERPGSFSRWVYAGVMVYWDSGAVDNLLDPGVGAGGVTLGSSSWVFDAPMNAGDIAGFATFVSQTTGVFTDDVLEAYSFMTIQQIG